uniref:Transmembrane protein 116 n=1 Tax=Myripristis murdjan TaxID=586833 RepID=A0A667Y180_9TELE
SASQRLLREPEVQPLLLLSVSDLLLAVCWLVGASLFSQDCSRPADCYNLHTAEQMLYMSSFLYTLNYIWRLYAGVRTRFFCSINGFPVQVRRRNVDVRKCACGCRVLPALLMTPVFVQGNVHRCYANLSQPYRCLLMQTGALFLTPEQQQQQQGACRLLYNYRIAVFLTTFLITLMGIVLMGKARRIYRRVVTSAGYLGDRQWASFRVVDRRMLLYPSVFIFCWGPAVYLAAARLFRPTAARGLASVVLYIAQAFTSGSQGFLNCLVYGWTHTQFRSASRRISFRDADTQTPLLRSQKRGYDALRASG